MNSLFDIEISGPGAAPTLVFLHGFMGCASDFDPLIARLKDHYRCIKVELPGHAGAALPPGTLSMPTLADRLREEVLNDLDQPTLVGYSMGGRLALQCALDHPNSVGKLILVSTSPGIEDPEERRVRREQDRLRAERIREDFEAFLRDWYRLPIFGELRESQGFAEMLARRRRQDPEAMARVIVELSPGAQPSNWARLGELLAARPRVLWLVGANDPKYRRLGEELGSRGHDVRQAPKAAHALHVEREEWLAEQITSCI
jgi:2-succinyl-6-hydroxy-2,4-cyclohexadiene-1-carboxylate synthase